MRPQRILAASAVLIAGAAALTGCSGGSGGGGGGGNGDGPVKMTLWQNATTGPGLKFWKDAAAGFHKANPNVTIDVQTVQNEDFDGKLQTAMNSGSAPDIFLQRGGGKMQAMVDAGQVKDITDGVGPAKQGIPDASFGAESIGGKIYAMPLSVLPSGIWYSQDLFKKAGIDGTPSTMDELDADVQKLKDAGVDPIALGAKDAWPAAHWYYNFALRECSPAVMEEAAKTKTFTDPCWLKAGQDLARFNATKPFNQGFLTTAAQQGAGSSAGLLANKKAAMELMGAWDPGVIASLTPDEKPLPDLGWFPFPEISGGNGKPGSIMGGVDGYSCSQNSPAQCVDFLNYLATEDQQVAYYKAFNAPPVNTEAQKSVTEPYLKDVLAAYNKAPFVSQWLDTVYGQNVGNALNVSVVNLLAGKGSPQGIVQTTNDAAKKG
ncbi:extracellular solute-binding protein [Amnibacterium endophyticum]|uniref:Extracellular solute-binding protein n=1 Tax=Amnibacterium endophyticum TaxID=2109337 RepID=A0ABW4LDM6_9MICO